MNNNSQKLKTMALILCNTFVTLPSLIYHNSINKYNKFTLVKPSYEPLKDKNIIIFVHGRNGSWSDFIQLINNIKKHTEILSVNQLLENGYSVKDKNMVIKLNNNLYALRTVDLGETGHTTIDEDSNRLHEQLAIYQDCQISLISYSKGGLVQ